MMMVTSKVLVATTTVRQVADRKTPMKGEEEKYVEEDAACCHYHHSDVINLKLQSAHSLPSSSHQKESCSPNEDKGAQCAKRFSPAEAKGVLLVGSLLTGPKSKDGQ